MNNLYLLQKDAESILDDLTSSVIRICSDSNVQDLYVIQNTQLERKYNYVSKAMDTLSALRSIKTLNSAIHSIYLYNENTKEIVSSTGEISNSANFYDTQWMDTYEKNSHKIVLLSSRKPIDDSVLSDNTYQLDIDREINRNVITFIYPLTLYPNSQLNGAIVINIYENALNFPIHYYDDHTQSSFLIIDKQGNVISDQSMEEESKEYPYIQQILNTDENKGYFMAEVLGKNYMITYSKSSIHDLIYIKTTSIDTLFQQVNYFKIWIIVLSSIILLLGIILSYQVSKKIYSPIKDTLENLKIQINKTSKEKRDELRVISDAVTNIIEEDEKIMKLYESNRHTMKESNALHLIRGDLEHIKAIFPMKQQGYVSIVISIDKYHDFAQKYVYREQFYFKTLLLKIAEQVTSENGYANGAGAILEQDKVALVVGITAEGIVEFSKIIQDIVDEIMKQTSVLEDFSISLGVGNIYRREERIRESYLEALETLNYRITFGYNRILYFEQLKDQEEILYQPITKEKHIMNYLKANAYKEIQTTIEEMIDDIQSIGAMRYESIIPIFYSLISKTMEYLVDSHVSISEIFEENFNIYKELTEQETLEDIKKLLFFVYDKIIAYQKANTVNDKKHIQKVIETIQNNYTRNDLDINWLVDELGISYSHLRKIIKENMGITFIQYLNQLRIKQSKEFLLTTDLTVKEIALKVGYNNDQSFTRYFKKYEGITPGEFRDNEKAKMMVEA